MRRQILVRVANGTGAPAGEDWERPMSADIIVSYDGTPNDDDALALGRLLGATGARLALAYVRHSREYDRGREQLAEHDAARRLEQGAAWLGQPDIARHVVFSASTGEGLAQLARAEGASLIVFGSDYRTPPGSVEPGASAQHLLEGGPVAVAVAPAGLRAHPNGAISSVAPFADETDGAAGDTLDALAARLGAEKAAPGARGVDLLVVGSQLSAPDGRIALSGAARSFLSSVRSAVVVVPRGQPVEL
jgi:nucleotide-binding universal stress UspA family protein